MYRQLTRGGYSGMVLLYMLMIRFQRIGRRNDPSFRMVVTEKTSGPKAGKFVDLVGTYNPKTKAFSANADRIKHWISNGAQVSPSLMNLLIKNDILKGKKINVLPKKSPIKKEVEESAKPESGAKDTAPKADTPVAEEAPAVQSAPAEVAA